MRAALRVRHSATAGDAGGQKALEAFDVYRAPPCSDKVLKDDADLQKIGTKPRCEVHRDGDWHRSVEVWLLDGADVLVQKRSALKDTNPGKLDASCAGHVTSGHAPRETALRELEEELGLRDVALEHAFVAPYCCKGEANGVFYEDNEFVDVYLAKVEFARTDFTIATSEVECLDVLPLQEVLDRLRSPGHGGFVPHPPYYVDALEHAALSQ